MKKIAVIAFANLRGTPYINSYLDVLCEYDVTADVIYWDRYGLNEQMYHNKTFVYKKLMPDETNNIKKFIQMKRYALFVQRILKNNDYDLVVVLTSVLAVFMCDFLVNNLSNRYIFDIRDHSYERVQWFYNKMNKLMKHSALNVISSPGFRNFLPKEKSIICHNCRLNLESSYRPIIKRAGKIIVSFIGVIRYADQYRDFLLQCKGVDDIEFRFYGYGEDEKDLKLFCEENGLKNVLFYGEFESSQKQTIIEDSDILFNVYGDDIHVKYALSNKYYDALYYKKPLIVNDGTEMAMRSGTLSFKYRKDSTVQQLVDWYRDLDEKEIDKICKLKLDEVKQDVEIFKSAIGTVVEEIN